MVLIKRQSRVVSVQTNCQKRVNDFFILIPCKWKFVKNCINFWGTIHSCFTLKVSGMSFPLQHWYSPLVISYRFAEILSKTSYNLSEIQTVRFALFFIYIFSYIFFQPHPLFDYRKSICKYSATRSRNHSNQPTEVLLCYSKLELQMLQKQQRTKLLQDTKRIYVYVSAIIKLHIKLLCNIYFVDQYINESSCLIVIWLFWTHLLGRRNTYSAYARRRLSWRRVFSRLLRKHTNITISLLIH